MLYVRKVILPRSISEDEAYAFIACSSDTGDSGKLHRVWSCADALDLLSCIDAKDFNYVHIRGYYSSDLNAWESQTGLLDPRIFSECRWSDIDQQFCFETEIAHMALLRNIKLQEYGDYAFGLTLSSILNLELDWNPRVRIGGANSIELLELPWDGAFEAHGLVGVSNLEFNSERKKIEYIPEPVTLDEFDITTEGRSAWQLFNT